MKTTSALLCGLALATLRLAAASTSINWRQEEGVYEVYGVTFEKFLELHPFTLLLLYNESEKSQEVREWLPKLHEMFAKRNVNVVVAKMRKSDGPRWIHEWNVKRLPYFRFCIGDGVSLTTRDYPEPEAIFDWVNKVYNTQLRVLEVNSKESKEAFHKETNAFYLRYNKGRFDYFEMLSKLQMVDPQMRVYFATNPAYDVFDNHKAEDMVIGFKRNFDEPIKYLSSPDKLNADNIQRFFHSYREPSTVRLTQDILNEIVARRVRTAYYYGSQETSKVLEAFRYIGFEQKDNYLFVEIRDNSEAKNLLGVQDEEDVIRILEFDGRDFVTFPVEGKSLPEIAASFERFSQQSFVEVERQRAHRLPEAADDGKADEALEGVTGEL